jgi:site-specific DNA-cytosine methylase
MALHTIELFAGVGQLGEGLRAGLGYLGVETRTVCYVEREAYAASVLAARMQEGSLDAAPIWSDVTTLDAHAGVAQWIASLAVSRAKTCHSQADALGLTVNAAACSLKFVRIADDCGARYLFLENVAGIASATATVVDEAEGTLDERAAARVLGELADLGWHAEWATLSASDVGASHGRARWFCWAWRVGEPESIRRPARRAEHAWQQRRTAFAVPGGEVGHTGLQHQHLQQREDGAEHSGAGCSVADSIAARHWSSPKASDAQHGGPNMRDSKGELPLPSQAANWATPQARDHKNPDKPESGNFQRKLQQGYTIDLNSQASNWPTPVANDDNKTPEAHMAMKARMPGGARNTITSLKVAVQVFSPQAQPTQHGPESSSSGPTSPRRLNPAFTEWLMGWPTGWTIAAPSASSAAATALWRHRLHLHLSALCAE